jgi:molybdopterin/thiamine biosynthesis adenylyltransferase
VRYLRLRLPDRDYVALLIGRHAMIARHMATGEAIEIDVVGPKVRFAFPTEEGANAYEEIYDRQARAFGAAGQRILGRLRVGIVGLGGTGSVTALELAYLGVRNFLLIDPQTLDLTNRNRVVGSKPDDVGTLKAELARRQILEIKPSANVETYTAGNGVLDLECRQKLQLVDFVFICTDSHASRAAACELCYQFLIAGIDVGVDINVKNGLVNAITGRAQMLAPGLPCLLCTSSINTDAVRRELMSPEQKAADPYFTGEGEPQPAVISVNGTISSLAVTMFLAAVVGIPQEARYLRYDGLKGDIRRVIGSTDSNCLFCSTSGALGRGDSRPSSFL